MVKRYFKRLGSEFKGYSGAKFGKDVLAGVTVAAVALPLALAFGVSSGATAASGLITAILAGVIIGKKFGTRFADKAGIAGGVILILIGIEIFVTGVFF